MQVCNDMRCLYHINDCVSALRMEIIEIDVSSMFSCTFCMHVSAHKVFDAKTHGAHGQRQLFLLFTECMLIMLSVFFTGGGCGLLH